MSDLEHHIKALHEIREKKREIQDLESETRLKIIELAGTDKQIALGGFELDVTPRTRFKIVDPELVPAFLKSTVPDQQRIDGYFQETGQVPLGVEIQESCVVRVQHCVTPKNTKSDGETGPECHSQVNSISNRLRECYFFEDPETGEEVFIDGTSPSAFGGCMGVVGEWVNQEEMCRGKEASFAEYGGEITKDDWTDHWRMCSACAARRAKNLGASPKDVERILLTPPMSEEDKESAHADIENQRWVDEQAEKSREQEKEQIAREELERKFDGHEHPWLD